MMNPSQERREEESIESGTCKAFVRFIGLESRYPGVHLTPDMFALGVKKI